MSGCQFPEHHGSGGPSIGPVAIVVGLVVLGASAITAIIHVIALVVTFVVLGAVVTLAVGGPLWLHHRMARRQLQTQYQPQMQAPRWQQQLGQAPGHALPTADDIADAIIRRYQGSNDGRR